MKSLNLTPSESLVILSPDSNGNKMIRLTLLDLIIKKALKVEISDVTASNENIIIYKDDSFSMKLEPHEEILTEVLSSNITLKELIDKIFNEVQSTAYRTYIISSLVDKGYFRRQKRMLMGLAPYYTYKLTDKGLNTRYLIKKLLNEAEYLKTWIREDLGHAKAYLSVVGSHIFISEIYSIDDIKKFSAILSNIRPDIKTSDYYDYYLYPVPPEYLDDNQIPHCFLDQSFFNCCNSLDKAFHDSDIVSADI